MLILFILATVPPVGSVRLVVVEVLRGRLIVMAKKILRVEETPLPIMPMLLMPFDWAIVATATIILATVVSTTSTSAATSVAEVLVRSLFLVGLLIIVVVVLLPLSALLVATIFLRLLVLEIPIPIALHGIGDIIMVHRAGWIERVLVLLVGQPFLHIVGVAVPQHAGESLVSHELVALRMMHHCRHLAKALKSSEILARFLGTSVRLATYVLDLLG